jgi:hypothetical protein
MSPTLFRYDVCQTALKEPPLNRLRAILAILIAVSGALTPVASAWAAVSADQKVAVAQATCPPTA